MNRTFNRVSRLSGSFAPPGDKSITHRGLILGAMVSGRSKLARPAGGADVASTARCLEILGFRVSASRAEIIVEGNGWNPARTAKLDAGNSGTTMRLLAGCLAGTTGEYLISGDASLSRRPMSRIAEPLRMMGAAVELAEDSHAPVSIRGGALGGIEYKLGVSSAQVKGCILLAGLQAQGETTVAEPAASRDHTERMLQWLGARIHTDEAGVSVTGGPQIFEAEGFDLDVPADLSSAAYLLVLACLTRRSEIVVENVGLNPTRTGILEALRTMGADISTQVTRNLPEPRGVIWVKAAELHGAEISGEMIPTIIDELPVLALAATQAEGQTVIRDAAELRVKESDRIAAIAAGLRALGAAVDATDDGMIINGPTPLCGGTVDSRGDHRVALSFAVAAALAADPVTISGWESTQVSYPEFERDLKALTS